MASDEIRVLEGGPLDVSTMRSPEPDLSLLKSHLWIGPGNQERKTTWVSSQADLGPDPSPSAWELRHPGQETLI